MGYLVLWFFLMILGLFAGIGVAEWSERLGFSAVTGLQAGFFAMAASWATAFYCMHLAFKRN